MLPNIDLEVYPMKTQKSFFEQNGGTYMQVGDVVLPDLNSDLLYHLSNSHSACAILFDELKAGLLTGYSCEAI